MGLIRRQWEIGSVRLHPAGEGSFGLGCNTIATQWNTPIAAWRSTSVRDQSAAPTVQDLPRRVGVRDERRGVLAQDQHCAALALASSAEFTQSGRVSWQWRAPWRELSETSVGRSRSMSPSAPAAELRHILEAFQSGWPPTPRAASAVIGSRRYVFQVADDYTPMMSEERSSCFGYGTIARTRCSARTRRRRCRSWV